ncbi:hypothetical protein [Tropicimonas marinistellae]|uniref:hypothetical protein n=1 Tax=Tropicimonas marinistellae TaxID=1739787 RepID=UPI00082B579B|nr:hypothetical protein [Tropicimonas marinistellae]
MSIDASDAQPDRNVAVLVSRMVYPDDDVEAAQVQATMAIEAERRRRDPGAAQGQIMAVVEKKLLSHKTLGRMAGDVALKMIHDYARQRRTSLEFASSFVSKFYAASETKGERYPADVTRLQKEFRYLKNSIHYWASWQICQETDDFDFVRHPAHLELLLLHSGLLQIAVSKSAVFGDWDPWFVPRYVVQRIRDERHQLEIPEETDFERSFVGEYRNKLGR